MKKTIQTLKMAFVTTLFGMGAATSSWTVEAAESNAATFNSKSVQVYVFKENGNPLGHESMVVTENDRIVAAWAVSTGRAQKRHWSIETPNGYYTFETYTFRNETTPNFNPSNAVVFNSDRRRIPIRNRENGLPAGTYNIQTAIHDSARVTGSPASHGCIRSNGTASLKRILERNGGLQAGALLVSSGRQMDNFFDQSEMDQIEDMLRW